MSDQKKKTILMFAAVIVAGGLIGFVARASDEEKAIPSAAPTQESFYGNPALAQTDDLSFGGKELFFKMMLSVLLVGGLAVGALYLSKKLLPNIAKASGKEIRVIETTYLGPRKALHLVEIGNQRLLVGSTNESITTLAHMDDAWVDLSKQELDHSVGG